jgi:hypothetical protein
MPVCKGWLFLTYLAYVTGKKESLSHSKMDMPILAAEAGPEIKINLM